MYVTGDVCLLWPYILLLCGDLLRIHALQGNLFLGSSTIVLQAVEKRATLHGLIVTGNVFHSWNTPNSTFVLDETDGVRWQNGLAFRTFFLFVPSLSWLANPRFHFESAGKMHCKGGHFYFPQEFVNVTETVVENNQVGPSVVGIGGKQSTRATIRAAVVPGTQVLELDFSEALLFGSAVRKQTVVFGCEVLERNARFAKTGLGRTSGKLKTVVFFRRSVSTRPTAG
eukprot:COSAG06_NODE_3071_length_5894_cov_6.093701_8_plen_227_part_00